MPTKSEPFGRERGYVTAARRFPQAELAIRRLMMSSETFRDICEELAEAETALSNVPQAPSELSKARRREFQDLIDRLVAEAGTALKESETRASKAGQTDPRRD